MSTALTTYLQHVKSLSGPQRLSLAAVTIPVLYTLFRTATTKRPQRQSKVPPTSERVLILGASSGVGQQIAHLYAHRGARVCVVGRRKDKVDEVVQECRVMSQGSTKVEVIGVTGDFAKVEDMVKIRETLEQAWGGLDTVIVSAGVSALQPLMAVAGLERQDKLTFSPAEANKDAIQRAADIATAATVGNYIGPLVSAVALIPLLQRTSASPSVLLISTLAAVLPPPTRSLYASTKAAALTLYQALAIEHPAIRFSHILPYTIEGDFRAGAVDKGPVREADPNKKGSGALSKLEVAQRCIQAVDNKDGVVFMPGWMRWGHFMYWIWPSFVENRARIKYNFH